MRSGSSVATSIERRAPLDERSWAKIRGASLQQVVGPQEGGIPAKLRGADGLAVQPLLQVRERGHGAGLGAPHQELAVDRPLEGQRFDEIGKGVRDVIAGTGIKAAVPSLGHGLHTDSIPFPLDGVGGRFEPLQIRGLERMRQHDRTKGCGGGGGRSRSPAREPGEKVGIRRTQPVP